MYKLKRNNKEFDIISTIEGNDIYNSDFLAKLDNIPYTYEYPYVYNKGRLDLVARDLYISDGYYSVPAIYNRTYLNKDTVITGMKFPIQGTIDNLLNT